MKTSFSWRKKNIVNWINANITINRVTAGGLAELNPRLPRKRKIAESPEKKKIAKFIKLKTAESDPNILEFTTDEEPVEKVEKLKYNHIKSKFKTTNEQKGKVIASGLIGTHQENKLVLEREISAFKQKEESKTRSSQQMTD